MVIFIHILCSIPMWIQLINDARGETRKINDLLVLIPLAIGLSIAGDYWWPHYHWYSTLPLMWGYQMMFFDYLENWALYKNKIGTRSKEWFTYLGNGTIDSIWKDWNPHLRYWIRFSIFFITTILYLTLH